MFPASKNQDRAFLRCCIPHAQQSKDPSTKLGAILVNQDGFIITWGCNNFPPGIEATHERLTDRETKLRLIIHAERSAVLNAARKGIRTNNTTLYFVATDISGLVWGGAPCVACAMELIQAGVKRIVSPPKKHVPSRWANEIADAGKFLSEAGIIVDEVDI